MSEKQTTLTVYQATYDLLRKLGLTTIFGNPGSTEQPFLKTFLQISNTYSVCRKRRQWQWPTGSLKLPVGRRF